LLSVTGFSLRHVDPVPNASWHAVSLESPLGELNAYQERAVQFLLLVARHSSISDPSALFFSLFEIGTAADKRFQWLYRVIHRAE
jgi:hypothetical protein